MDPATALVQAYLYANGYFTVTEYPVIEARAPGAFRTATDIDVLALRFPGARRVIPGPGGGPASHVEPDPALEVPETAVDLLIAEVKEGDASLNRGARDPDVLKVALGRFGAAPPGVVDPTVEALLRHGTATTDRGIRIRLVAFGSVPPEVKEHAYKVLTHGHVLTWLRARMDANWDWMQYAQFKDPAMGFLMLDAKARRGGGDGAAKRGPSDPRHLHRRKRHPPRG